MNIRTNLQERLKDGSILMLLAALLAFGAVYTGERAESRTAEIEPVVAPVAATAKVAPIAHDLLPR